LVALSGVIAAAFGLVMLLHPIAGWPYGAPRRADVPPVIGVSVLVWPAVLVAVGVRKAWQWFTLEVEVRRRRHRARS
jgi:hypothetical protein